MSENFKIRLNKMEKEKTGKIIDAKFRFDGAETAYDQSLVYEFRNELVEDHGLYVDIEEWLAEDGTVSGIIKPVYKPDNWKKFKKFIKEKWPKMEIKFRRRAGE